MTECPKVTCVIVAYNSGADHLQRAMDGLAAQDYPNLEIVLYDNASPRAEQARSVELPANARLVVAPDNTGFSGGNNRALASSDAEFFALLNPDAIPQNGWVSALVAAMARHKRANMAASLQLMAENPDLLDGAGDHLHIAGVPYRGGFGQKRPEHLAEGPVFGPCGAGALYRADAFRAVGGFDEDLFCYVEDVDLAFRLRLIGGWCVFVPDAVITHVGSASLGRRSDFAIWHGARNRLTVLVANAPFVLLAGMMLLHLPFLMVLFARTLLRDRKEAMSLARGTAAGIARLPSAWAKRASRMRSRTASLWQLARAMTWSPVKLFTRGIDIKPMTHRAGERKSSARQPE
jgi:N-acetylglucosaminyl-diphospho-decaprenol L-rhamnosyltransferase